MLTPGSFLPEGGGEEDEECEKFEAAYEHICRHDPFHRCGEKVAVGGLSVAETGGAQAAESGEETVGEGIAEGADYKGTGDGEGDVDGSEGGDVGDFARRKYIAVYADDVYVAGVHGVTDFVGEDAVQRAEPVHLDGSGS